MSIYRDKKSGRWRFEFDHYINGERVRRRQLLPAGWSRAQAEAFDRKEGSALSAIAHGIAKPRYTVDQAVAGYLKGRAPQLKHGANVGRELEALRDWFTGRPVEDLPTICAEYAQDQHGALAPATIKNRISYLRAACRWAWKHLGMGEADPGARVVAPTVRNAREVIVDRKQMLQLARACQHRGAGALVRILFYSGMRVGEVYAAQRVPGVAFVLTDTKNGKPRVVPMHRKVRTAALVPLVDRSKLPHYWGKARTACGLPHVHLHDLRHSAASEMINAGVDLATVGAVLGHATTASTKRYSHWATSRLAEALDTIGRKVPHPNQSQGGGNGAASPMEARPGVEPGWTDLQSQGRAGRKVA